MRVTWPHEDGVPQVKVAVTCWWSLPRWRVLVGHCESWLTRVRRRITHVDRRWQRMLVCLHKRVLEIED
ncbi:TPA: hypothetical protein N0F65_000811 [Lagenidium giganteum]|uniref:Uncharacterized protein n=1 Tax=Lagenidium giganteum TaxID=4803 RepID=A0AAV2YZC4_9STRA|nr:TPA: hypothetical protein N0F65_000811 [Lagenidium giganteum]